MFEDILEMKLGTVILAHSRSEAAACYRRCAAGGTALGDLDDANGRFGTFEGSHRAGRPAADDQHVCLVTLDRNLKTIEIAATCHRFRKVFAISTNAFTQASANTVSLTCNAKSSIGATFSRLFKESMKSWYSSGRFHGPLSLPARSCARRLVCSLKPSSGTRTRTGPLAALSRLPISEPSFLNSSALVRISKFCALYRKNSRS